MTQGTQRLGAPRTLVHAGTVSRLAAFVIDVFVVTLASGFVSDILAVLFDIFGLSLFWWGKLVLRAASVASAIGISFCCLPLAWSLLGCSPGKALLGMRVVDKTGRAPHLGWAVVRFVGYWISALPLFLGFAWALVDAQHQGWHDKLAGTYVVKIWKGQRGTVGRWIPS